MSGAGGDQGVPLEIAKVMEVANGEKEEQGRE